MTERAESRPEAEVDLRKTTTVAEQLDPNKDTQAKWVRLVEPAGITKPRLNRRGHQIEVGVRPPEPTPD